MLYRNSPGSIIENGQDPLLENERTISETDAKPCRRAQGW